VKLRKPLLWGVGASAVIYFCLVALYERYDSNQGLARLKEHTEIIDDSLWNLDPDSAVDYLTLVATLENEEQITIVDDQGRPFLHIDGPTASPFDRLFMSLGLLPLLQLEEPIVRQGNIIGELQVVHRHDVIHKNLYLLVVMVLVLVVYILFLRTLGSKKELAHRVSVRTAELMEANEKLTHVQKLESVGQLAGGVAHDFNNLLTAIIGNAELLQIEVEPNSNQSIYTQAILGASGRAADLTKQLLDFSRKGKMRTVEVDLHSIVGEVRSLAQRSVDKKIELVLNLEASSSIVVGDPSQLQSAILNLALNSRDAMPKGGKLTFASRNVLVNEPYSVGLFHDIQPGQYVEVSVSDTGVGMGDELQKSVFEPFFTTKEQGKGTGLGLASVYGCVKDHQGAVSVYSEPGRGSTFKVMIPVISTSAPLVSPFGVGPVHGQGHILVVDDEESIREFSRKALTKLGYTVSLCCDGAEAVEFFRLRHLEIDLVILDQIMPVMGGEETFIAMKEIDAGVRVLIASGFAYNGTVDRLVDGGALGFLSKPFGIDDLSLEVARSLADPK